MAVESATFKLSALLIPSLKFGMDNSPVSWLEHLTVNQRVLGSSPRGGATYNDITVILL